MAYCPERIAQGYAIRELPELPQLVAGLSEKATGDATALFGRITRKILPVSMEEAELAKKELRLPVQIGYPQNISTIIDRVDDPAYATAVGLVLWADEYLSTDKTTVSRFARKVLENASIEKMRKFFKQFLP